MVRDAGLQSPMLLRIARSAPSLARLRPALGRALPPVVAASVGITMYSAFSAPALCMFPPLEPETLADQVEDTVRAISRYFREICRGGREIRNKKSH